ncbi:hypothetical protein BGZ60DRAFT_429873 [Tricladium varicosporioides]|nr:hypothetical protein BGZ60DRAFT_429873 [Hymenoscyphus varicosporioides]
MSEQPQDVAVIANAMDISHFAPPSSGGWEDIPRTMDDWTIMPAENTTAAPAPPGSPPSGSTSNAANSPDAATTPASSIEEPPTQSSDGQQTTEAIPGSIVAVPEAEPQAPSDQSPPNPDAIVEDAKEEKKEAEEESEEDRDIYDDGAWTTNHVLEFLDMASDKHLELYRGTCSVCKTFQVKEKEKIKVAEPVNETEDVVMGLEVVENVKTADVTLSEESGTVAVAEDDPMNGGEEQLPTSVATIDQLNTLNAPTEPLPPVEASEDTPMEEAKPVEEPAPGQPEEVVKPVKSTKTAPKEVESEFPPGWKWSKGCEVCLCHYYQPRPGDEEDFQTKCEEAREMEKARKIKVAEEAAIAAKLAEEAAIAAKIAEEEAVAKAAEMAKKAVEEAEAAAEKAKQDLERGGAQVVEVPVEIEVIPNQDESQAPPQPPAEPPVEPSPEQVTEQTIEQPPQPPVEEQKSNEVEMEGVEASTPAPENPPTAETEASPLKEEEAPKEDVIMEETPEPEIPEPEISPELKALRHSHRSLLVSDAHFTCQICHFPYFSHRPQNGPERPVTTPCHHIAGVACLEEWVEGRDRPGCPFCRQPLIFGCNHKIAHHNAFEKSTPKKIGAGEIMKECYDCGMEKINGKWERAEMLARDARRNAQTALQSAEVRVQDMGSLTPEDEKKRWVTLRDLYQQSVAMSEEVREKDRIQREAETKAFKEPLKGTWCKVYGSRYPDESEDEGSPDDDNENERDDQSDSSDSDSDDGHADNSARRGGRGGFRGRGRGGRGRGGGW